MFKLKGVVFFNNNTKQLESLETPNERGDGGLKLTMNILNNHLRSLDFIKNNTTRL